MTNKAFHLLRADRNLAHNKHTAAVMLSGGSILVRELLELIFTDHYFGPA